jgi:hypothetical protein
MPPAPAGRQRGNDPHDAVTADAWTEGAKDAWFRTHERTNMSGPGAPISHIVTFRPDIRIRVLAPPWADADAWLDKAHRGWNDWLSDGGEIWTEPAGAALIDVQVLGSTAEIDDVRSGRAGTNGTTNQPHPARATAQLVLPVDEDLSAALSTLEEILLALLDVVADARPAADTAGGLAASVDPDRSGAVQPAVGLTEVVPLAFPVVPQGAVDQLVAVASRVIAPNAPDVAETVAEVALRRHVPGTWEDDGGVRSEITAVLAVLQVDPGDDLDALARLHQPVAESPCGRDESDHETVVLTDLEAVAYGRVVDRNLRAWRPDDPLARFLYEGR